MFKKFILKKLMPITLSAIMLLAVFGFSGCSLRTRRITDFAGLEDLPTNPDRITFSVTRKCDCCAWYEETKQDVQVPPGYINYVLELILTSVYRRMSGSCNMRISLSLEFINIFKGEYSWGMHTSVMSHTCNNILWWYYADGDKLREFLILLAFDSPFVIQS